jgi:hypothetical protein
MNDHHLLNRCPPRPPARFRLEQPGRASVRERAGDPMARIEEQPRVTGDEQEGLPARRALPAKKAGRESIPALEGPDRPTPPESV